MMVTLSQESGVGDQPVTLHKAVVGNPAQIVYILL